MRSHIMLAFQGPSLICVDYRRTRHVGPKQYKQPSNYQISSQLETFSW